mmetsp:Transcript_31550/g.93915  ORF Transcript_31550/g.93915 Transcript_31550/m.93915 type:complete len:248 (-) Transcript_31550:476-1219(-)
MAGVVLFVFVSEGELALRPLCRAPVRLHLAPGRLVDLAIAVAPTALRVRHADQAVLCKIGDHLAGLVDGAVVLEREHALWPKGIDTPPVRPNERWLLPGHVTLTVAPMPKLICHAPEPAPVGVGAVVVRDPLVREGEDAGGTVGVASLGLDVADRVDRAGPLLDTICRAWLQKHGLQGPLLIDLHLHLHARRRAVLILELCMHPLSPRQQDSGVLDLQLGLLGQVLLLLVPLQQVLPRPQPDARHAL